MIIFLLGPSGSGKGKICDYISVKYPNQFAVIDVGNIVRNEIKKGTEVGNNIKSKYKSISLVDDHIIIDLITPHVQKAKSEGKNIIFDGFPRTLNQAKIFMLKNNVYVAVLLDIKYKRVVEVLKNRRVCILCGCVTNLLHDSKARFGLCRKCGGPLAMRNDDNEEAILAKYEMFQKEYLDICKLFGERVIKVNANYTEDQTVREFLEKFQKYYSTHKPTIEQK